MEKTSRKAVIKNADMNEDMQTDAIDCASMALDKFSIEQDIAAFIKKEFDKNYLFKKSSNLLWFQFTIHILLEMVF